MSKSFSYIIVKRLFIYLLAILCAALTACDSDPKLTITGDITDAGARTIVLTCYIDGGHKQVAVPATDGRFSITVSVPRPSLATLSLSDGTQLATLILENGQELTVSGTAADPSAITVEGDDACQLLAEWRRSNADALGRGDAAAINASISEFIADNTSSTAAIALLVTQFRTEGYEKMADSLFMAIPAESRPSQLVENFNAVLAGQLSLTAITEVEAMNLYESHDTIVSYSPRSYLASILCFMPAERSARDSIVPALRAIVDSLSSKQFRAVEISTAPDSASWAASIRSDSATWHQTWMPASVSSSAIRRLAVPRSPYFIVADGQGAQMYRGPSVSRAIRTAYDQISADGH